MGNASWRQRVRDRWKEEGDGTQWGAQRGRRRELKIE